MKQLTKFIIDWHDQYGRKDLPWQLNKNPYRVWISEVMLQQTQVATVLDRYILFLETFPNIDSLANASMESVYTAFSGMGYYRRAKHLHAAAKIMQISGFPDEKKALVDLPGIGESTAHAILSFAFNKQYPILDANVKRVYQRIFLIADKKQLWQTAYDNIPETRHATYNQALMDIGALICKKKPLCDICPCNSKCLSYKDGRNFDQEKSLSQKVVKKNVYASVYILKKGNQFALVKQDADSFWSGMYSLPIKISAFVQKNTTDTYDIRMKHYDLTHRRIYPTFLIVSALPREFSNATIKWINEHQLNSLGVSTFTKKVIQLFNEK